MDSATNKLTLPDQHPLSGINESGLDQSNTRQATFGSYKCSVTPPLRECGKEQSLRESGSVDDRFISKMEKQLTVPPREFDHMLPDLSVQEELVCQLARQSSIAHIDAFSLENMAAALFYSGINTFDEVLQLDLKIIPPGPVFHTWYAFHGTTLFDGENNSKGFDYVKLISEEASRLSKSNIPVLLIYTNNSMDAEQIKTMNSLFVDRDNVLVISIEEDLSHLPMVDKFKDQKLKNMILLDGIRVCAIVDAKRVLLVARDKSKQLGKELLHKRLSLWEDKSLTYNDIDNVFIRPAAFQIAANGLCKISHLNTYGFFIDEQTIEEMPESMKDRAKAHNSYLEYLLDCNLINVQDLERQSERLFRYIISGRARKEYQEIMNKPEEMETWSSETNYYASSTELLSKEDIERIMSRKYIRDSFSNHLETLSHCLANRRKLSRLEGIQQLRLIKMNYHRSWREVRMPEK